MPNEKTSIEWTEATWSPTTGCDRVSPGCDHCYALTLAKRLKGMGSKAYQEDGDPRTSGPGFLAHEWPPALTWPLHKKKPLRIFVNSMSDLFHDNITDEYIAQVFAVMGLAPQHTFQVLTKRHGRMRSLLDSRDFRELVWWNVTGMDSYATADDFGWPLRNVWLGVSVENQQWADIRIPALLDTPAAVRFLSCEPLLGPIDLRICVCGHRWDQHESPDGYERSCTVCFDDGTQEGCADYESRTDLTTATIDWVIAGGESGAGARPMHPDWARSLRDQCVAAGVPFLFKQWGGRTPKAGGRTLDGRTWNEYPETAAAPA